MFEYELAFAEANKKRQFTTDGLNICFSFSRISNSSAGLQSNSADYEYLMTFMRLSLASEFKCESDWHIPFESSDD